MDIYNVHLLNHALYIRLTSNIVLLDGKWLHACSFLLCFLNINLINSTFSVLKGFYSLIDQEFHKSRVARGSVFPAASYSPPEESSFNQDVVSAVEGSMKKYSDNIMRFLEGLSSRLSQLELYCYNLDKSIGEMRSDLVRDHEGSDSRLKSLEKHMQEVCFQNNTTFLSYFICYYVVFSFAFLFFLFFC